MSISLQDLVNALELRHVYATDLQGSRMSGAQATSFQYAIEPEFRRSPELVDYRYRVQCEPCDERDQKVADIAYTVIASYDVTNADLVEQASDEVISQFGDNIALFAAYPYLRAGVQDVASRLNLPGVTLGLLRRGEGLPEGMTLAGATDAELND